MKAKGVKNPAVPKTKGERHAQIDRIAVCVEFGRE